METLPKTLSVHSAYQKEYLRRLKALPYYDFVAPVIEDFLRRIIACGEFYIRVPASTLGKILDSGRIRSMTETLTGTTTGGIDTRKEVTEALFGCNAAGLKASEFPKYGFLSQKDAAVDLYLNGGMWTQYGDVSIQLKKERLIGRTTICVGDSVNFGRCFTLIPTRTDDIKATCVCGPQHGGKSLMVFQDPLFCYEKMAEWILTGKLTEKNFPEIDRIAEDAPPVFEFFELQFHGPLDVSKDVRRIDVIAADDKEKEMFEALAQRFESIGIPFHISSGLI